MKGQEGKVPRKGITLIKERIWTGPTWTSRFGRRNRTNITQSSRLTGPRIIILRAAVHEIRPDAYGRTSEDTVRIERQIAEQLQNAKRGVKREHPYFSNAYPIAR
jgi:hypothetical protein